MVRLNFLLLLMVMVTAFALVQTQYQARGLLAETFKLQKQESKLLANHGRLVLERRTASNNMQVEKLARKKLRMDFVRPGVTHYFFRDQKTAQQVRSAPMIQLADPVVTTRSQSRSQAHFKEQASVAQSTTKAPAQVSARAAKMPPASKAPSRAQSALTATVKHKRQS